MAAKDEPEPVRPRTLRVRCAAFECGQVLPNDQAVKKAHLLIEHPRLFGVVYAPVQDGGTW